MALRNQPYIPLMVQDVLTDEKLIECSAMAHGVYFRLMCLMHKSEEYGVILLKQKYKQTVKQVENFALQLAKSMPFDVAEITVSLDELVSEGVLILDGERLIQKRMVKDNEKSIQRAISGSIGGKKTQEKISKFASKFAKASAKANNQANTEYEYVTENEIEIKDVIKNITLEEFKKEAKALCSKNGYIYDDMAIEGKFLAWQSDKWKDGFGKPIKNWKSKLMNTMPHILKKQTVTPSVQRMEPM